MGRITSRIYKGSINVVGIYNQNEFKVLDPSKGQKLSPIMSNPLFRGVNPPDDIDCGQVNNLFSNFIINHDVQAVSTKGNFEIINRRISSRSAMQNYFIKPLNHAYFIKHYKYESESDDGYKDLNNYHDLIKTEDGYMRIPHHRIYLATGSRADSQSWLCMLLETGSSSYGFSDGEAGSEAIKRHDYLKGILEKFINRESYTDPVFLDGSQGKICKATKGDQSYYISMLDPIHVRESKLGSIAQTLKNIIPPLEYCFIDSTGERIDEITNDNLLVFVTPELYIVASKLQNSGLDQKLRYCLAVVQFIKELINNDIVCTDLTWEDIAIYEDRCFCCDYGGYLPMRLLSGRRDSLITKPGYEAPETTDINLGLDPEKFQVHFLGELLFQVLFDQENIAQNVEEIILNSCKDNPEVRPGIDEIIDLLLDPYHIKEGE